MKRTKKLTVCALMSAMSVAILYFSSLFSTIDLSLSLFASFLILIVLIELGTKWAFGVYLVTSLLSLLLLPQKYIACMYLLFCGIYPLLRILFNKMGKILAFIIKTLYFGITLTLVFLASKFVFKIEVYSGFMLAVFYGVSFLAFYLSDILLEKLTRLYYIKFRKALGIDRLFK